MPKAAPRNVMDEKFDPQGYLAASLGRAPDEDELLLWATMPAEKRAAALKRIDALRKYRASKGEMTAAEAAIDAKTSVSRFYSLIAAWENSPTLKSVGTLAKRPGRKGPRLDSEVINKIQKVLPIVARDLSRRPSKIKISDVVNGLTRHESLKGVELPHVNTLRTMAQREIRRLSAEVQVGLRPGLDAIACDLVNEDGRPHIIFAVIDRTSRLMLGFSIGHLTDSVSAYGRAAQDALLRIEKWGGLLPWADTVDRVDVIVGNDAAAWTEVLEDYRAAEIGTEFNLVTSDLRYGRYFKLTAGQRLGTMKIWQKRTGTEQSLDGHVYTEAQATAAVEVEIARHNEQVLSESTATGAVRPPPQMLKVLRFLESGASG